MLKNITMFILICWIGAEGTAHAGNLDRDMVPDERTAIRVASAILETYMGTEQFSKAVRTAPLRTSLSGDIWTVYFYPADAGLETKNSDGTTSVVVVAGGGGKPEIQIAKTDARVIGLFYSR